MILKYLKEVESTQKYLKNYIYRTNSINKICFYTYEQTLGQGSQNNTWEGKKGNLFFSFVIPMSDLPKDLPLQSASIYFSFILKNILSNMGSNIILKWPNDFYISSDKIGGLITNKIKDNLICGIGINIIKTKSYNGCLDINIDKYNLLKQYFEELEIYPTWKQIFSKYKLEFHHNKKYFTNINNEKLSMVDATLNEDGSLNINKQKVYSLR